MKTTHLAKTIESGTDTLSILTDINLEIQAGETVAIIGVSGSGKSTLLSLLAGLDLPSHGQVILNNHDLASLDEDGRAKLRQALVGFVFQSFYLLPSLNALENVMLPLELAQEKQAKNLAKRLLIDVGLGARFTHYPNQLSGGEQQRVAIARAFASQPKLLFADEPTGNLDPDTGQHIIELLFQLNKRHNTTLVLVTHDTNLAQRCQRQLRLANGQLHTCN